ncbi:MULTISPECIES: GIY-YIG nuclease family protein [unclassified Staphylococcus]|uniref:GIY-YIG nuclease family protein n=1 Tax=unclassified Staphylococcus TaxID=91994 RepID=UPI0021D3A393|nr:MULTISPECIES: GIY-YIG nuclease family protein [unclassified Staphylococcus]UXR78508.1 GIY-YIG nuclease family protein [Staphylococcus sp. IVB6227]UXR82665.1 GIY-YIG nuclease family protein [Staphylococcus sp. IVB6214]
MVKHYTYMVECADRSLYTGYTTDLTARIHKHNEGKGAKYTKTRRPVRLKYYEIYETKSEALKREYAIKQLTRQQKIALIEER